MIPYSGMPSQMYSGRMLSTDSQIPQMVPTQSLLLQGKQLVIKLK